jgi:hypothetical protein
MKHIERPRGILWADIIAAAVVIAVMTTAASAQYRYLGAGTAVPDRTSAAGVTYNTAGLELVSSKQLAKSTARLTALGASSALTARLAAFPALNFGDVIDAAFGTAQAQFTACGGDIAARATAFQPSAVRVQLEPTAFTDPAAFGATLLVGETVWSTRTIHAVGFYAWAVPGQAQPDAAWLRSVLAYEWTNAIAGGVGVSAAEPHPAGWPCQ